MTESRELAIQACEEHKRQMTKYEQDVIAAAQRNFSKLTGLEKSLIGKIQNYRETSSLNDGQKEALNIIGRKLIVKKASLDDVYFPNFSSK